MMLKFAQVAEAAVEYSAAGDVVVPTSTGQPRECTDKKPGTVLGFEQELLLELEEAIDSHAYSLEASIRVIQWHTCQGSSFLPV
jgi:hypothetical protein